MGIDGVVGQRNRPEQAARVDARVYVDDLNRTARTGREDVDSHETDGGTPYATVDATIDPRHEAHVRAEERQLHGLSGRAGASCHRPADICQPDKAIEVRDRRGLCVNRVQACGRRASELSSREPL